MKRSGWILLRLVSLAMLAVAPRAMAQIPRAEPVTQVVPVASPAPLPPIGEAPNPAATPFDGLEPVPGAASSPAPAVSGTLAEPVAEPAAPPPASSASTPEATATPPAVSASTPQHAAAPPAMSGTQAAAVPSPAPPSPYSIEIDLTHQCVYLLKDGEKFAESPISSGRAGHLTPTGDFAVIEKDLNHTSNLYGKIVEKGSGRVVKAGADSAMPVPKGCAFVPAPMKWFMRFDGAAGMHAGILPGYPASHGCVRMPAAKAELFYSLVEVGTPVHVFGTPPVREESEEEEPRERVAFNPKGTPTPTPKPRHFLWF